jgi:glycosyltransferase involved in cell wall biosynthesis
LSDRPLRVAVEARLVSGLAGGVESVVIGLADSLSRLADGDEEYLFGVWTDSREWIEPYISGNARLLELGPGPEAPRTRRLRSALKRVPGAQRAGREGRRSYNDLVSLLGERTVRMRHGDRGVEQSGAELVHFPTQAAFLTDLPSIYHPHDLQHLHLPENFTRRERLNRTVTYRAFCKQASVVAVTSSWVKRDVVEHFGLPADKVAVIPLAPILGAYDEPAPDHADLLRRTHVLPERFVLYPAQTWPHKNHLALLDALRILRDGRDLVVPLVCTGRLTEFFPTIEKHVRRLRLEDQVRFLGFVPTADLKSLTRLATATVIPTKFEAASGPLWDSFIAETPAACSTVTSLPEQADGAALLFDPDSPTEIADVVAALWTDETLRRDLVQRGLRNVHRLSWDRTARMFRAHYRRVTKRPLTGADVELLNAPPLF